MVGWIQRCGTCGYGRQPVVIYTYTSCDKICFPFSPYPLPPPFPLPSPSFLFHGWEESLESRFRNLPATTLCCGLGLLQVTEAHGGCLKPGRGLILPILRGLVGPSGSQAGKRPWDPNQHRHLPPTTLAPSPTPLPMSQG